MKMENKGKILLYEGIDGKFKVDVRLENETVRLSQKQMAEIFGVDVSGISRHLKNIFSEGELDEEQVVAFFANTTQHGFISGKTQINDVKFYNLDVIISLGYRVNSYQATQFRKWATARLKEYIIKGFTLDDERLKGNGGGKYGKGIFSRLFCIFKNFGYTI